MGLRTVLNDLAFPEGPRWRDGELFFSDMHAHQVVAMRPDGTRRTVYQHDGPVSGLGWLADGRMLVVSMEDRRLLRLAPDGTGVVHADLSTVATINANDMVVDAKGRAFVGNFGFSLHDGAEPAPARMARVEPDGSVHEAAADLMFPNGCVVTPDGAVLVVAESFAMRLTAFDIGPRGELSNRRAWAQLAGGAVPDGICLDADGAIWVASPTTNEALRVHEGGAVSARVACERGVYACMLGGDDRRTLFLCTAETSDPRECAAQRNGRIEAIEVDIPGAGLP